tara:strand:+ start:123 stop:590 length:468 start_codon:yes stop_codon:yes gene_type:complete
MDEKPPSDVNPKKKGPLGKLKEKIDDKEEQLVILSTFVRLGVVVWSGFILTLNYVEIPGLGQQERIDPTFIASVFTGALASFGLETAKKRGDGTYKSDADKPMNKKEIEAMLANNQSGAVQTIRVLTPIKIEGAEVVKYDPITGKEIDPQSGKLT